jgi:hypothetical protein
VSEQDADGVAVNYWETQDGILERFSMLAEDVQLSSFNGAVKVYGTALGVTDFVISGNLKTTSCEWCIGHVGVVYHRGSLCQVYQNILAAYISLIFCADR